MPMMRRTPGLVIACLLLEQAAASGGYTFEAAYTADILANTDGGVERGTRYLDNLDLALTVDMAEVLGRGRGTLFLYGLYNNGTKFAELTGDLQVTSNIDAPEALRLFEAWYEFGDGPWSLRAGLYDLNSEFDVNETGSLFINSSHGVGAEVGQTGENGPSIFPVSSLALRAAWQRDGFTARIAVLDGVPGHPQDPASNEVQLGDGDGALVVVEGDFALPGNGRLWGGHWHYTANFDYAYGNGRGDSNDGWYAGAERGFELFGNDASAFLRAGVADDRYNPIGSYVGAGVVVEGAVAGRPSDQLGLAIASASVGAPYREFLAESGSGSDRRETTWELTWRAPFGEHLALQPNLQFVRNPAADESIDDAVVFGLRIELAY